MQITIYTDGSCPKPHGPGGWGFVIVGREDDGCWGPLYYTTNQRAELTAAIEALKRVAKYNYFQLIEKNDRQKLITCVNIYSDSQYVVKGCNEWRHTWIMNNWRNSGNEEVKNMDLWQTLNALLNERSFETKLYWVKGHNGNLHNEIADELAAKGTITARGIGEERRKRDNR